MKKICVVVLIVVSAVASAQNIAINNTGAAPHPSAMLDVSSANKGLLMPRVILTGTSDALTVPTPAPYLLVYNTSGSLSNGLTGAGLYVNTGTMVAPSWLRIGNSGSGNAWSLTGNAGTDATNFLGTTDLQSLQFRVNDQRAGLIDPYYSNAGFGHHVLDSFVSNAYNNAAIGAYAMQLTKVGSFNSGVGYGALRSNNGYDNVAVGWEALFVNTTGSSNTAVGSGNSSGALGSNTTGANNTAAGFDALTKNIAGYSNTAVGMASLRKITDGHNLLAVGDSAMASMVSGLGAVQNTAIGSKALYAATGGGFGSNTGVGYQSLMNTTTGGENTATGTFSLLSNTTGNQNAALGLGALRGSTTGDLNTAVGAYNLYRNAGGDGNTGVGGNTMIYTTGSNNTAIGSNVMNANTTGYSNVAIGSFAMNSNQTDHNIVAIGDSALYSLKNVNGSQNLAIGSKALYAANGTGYGSNTAIGFQSMKANLDGGENTAVGTISLLTNSSGNQNAALGHATLRLNTSGDLNAAFGAYALYRATTANGNTALGGNTMISTTTGSTNTAVGTDVLNGNTSGYSNTAIGSAALAKNQRDHNTVALGDSALFNLNYVVDAGGSWNTAIGSKALYSEVGTGQGGNTGTGYQVLYNTTIGSKNSALGAKALFGNTTGIYNTAIGYYAGGLTSTNHTNCTFVGYATGPSVAGSNFVNSTAIGSGASILQNNEMVLGSGIVKITSSTTSITAPSDMRLKKEVQANVPGLSFITALTPITYKLRGDLLPGSKLTDENIKAVEAIVHSGFSAQQVDSVTTALGYKFSGLSRPAGDNKYYGLGYSDFVPALVQSIKEQQAIIVAQDKKIEDLQKQIDEIKKLLQR